MNSDVINKLKINRNVVITIFIVKEALHLFGEFVFWNTLLVKYELLTLDQLLNLGGLYCVLMSLNMSSSDTNIIEGIGNEVLWSISGIIGLSIGSYFFYNR